MRNSAPTALFRLWCASGAFQTESQRNLGPWLCSTLEPNFTARCRELTPARLFHRRITLADR
jgi:hypothetical protein